uniref:Uncharacterized protein n=1 Tax=Arundo donax TaxID=35708 RepID=A0A0A9DJ09_ARUDO
MSFNSYFRCFQCSCDCMPITIKFLNTSAIQI